MKAAVLALLIAETSAVCFNQATADAIAQYLVAMEGQDNTDMDTADKVQAKIDSNAKTITGLEANDATKENARVLTIMNKGYTWYKTNFAESDKLALAAKDVVTAIDACKADDAQVPFTGDQATQNATFEQMGAMAYINTVFAASAKADKELEDLQKKEVGYANYSDSDKQKWDKEQVDNYKKADETWANAQMAEFGGDKWLEKINSQWALIMFSMAEQARCYDKTGQKKDCVKAQREKFVERMTAMKANEDIGKSHADFKAAWEAQKSAMVAAALAAKKPAAGAAGSSCKKPDGADAKRPECNEGLCCGDLVKRPAEGKEPDYTTQLEVCAAKDAKDADIETAAATASASDDLLATVVDATTEKGDFRCIAGAKSLVATAAAAVAATYMMA